MVGFKQFIGEKNPIERKHVGREGNLADGVTMYKRMVIESFMPEKF